MRDPFSWSFPIGRLFGIAVRIHFLFPLVALGLVLRVAFMKDAAVNIWVDATMVVGLLFVAVLLHELGHCFAGRSVGGDAQEVLLWPLGGLAAVDTPHTPRANFVLRAGPQSTCSSASCAHSSWDWRCRRRCSLRGVRFGRPSLSMSRASSA
jgi:Zn-dependent protease